jgi:uncharacterized membrane protein
MSQKAADTAEIEPHASRRRNRNEGIDFVRGSLIILMILYHSVIFSRGDQLALFLREYFLTVTSGASTCGMQYPPAYTAPDCGQQYRDLQTWPGTAAAPVAPARLSP